MTDKVTLNDIAKLAQVSPTTVSIILNNKDTHRFSAETMATVHRCAKELGYERHNKKVARSGNLRVILIFCPSVINMYYATLIQGIEQAARDESYHTIIATTYWDQKVETHTLDQLRGCPLAGIIYCMPPQDLQQVESTARTIPTVVIGDRSSEMNLDMAEMNNYNAATLIARHLIALGHRNVAYITTTIHPGHPARQRRLRGIQETYERECPDGKVSVWEYSVAAEEERHQLDIEHTVGSSLTRQALSDPDITAFVGINDMVAYGVLDTLEEMGYRVPQDYSVCGFDNLLPSRFHRVQLTTVEHSIIQKGHSAFRLLRDQLEAADGHSSINGNGSVTRVEYPSVLVVGKTTAAPRCKKPIKTPSAPCTAP